MTFFSRSRFALEICMNENLILIVDDDPCWGAVLETLLQDRGFQVISAENDLEGIEAAIVHQPSLILMDMNIPGMNVYVMTRALRAYRQIANVPIVGTSANNDLATRMMAVEAGMCDFVAKPWS